MSESDMPSHIVYADNDDGISVEFDDSEKRVQAVNYFPPIREQHLMCPGAATLARDFASTQKYRIDYYSPIDIEAEKTCLDHLASELSKAGPNWNAYVLIYSGPRAQRDVTKTVARRVKKYLTGEKRLRSTRIFVIEGGYRDAAQADVFMIPRGRPGPVPMPTIDPRDVGLDK